ncbi:DegT/DnrJ/EryC1/StrS family aminotransferase [Sphingomonas lycopersici]|uniref:DegT/DnrJ/EryC1/StrS family aminotransferase n=1 Tax=Sphingomonas lycopersici TaxID=2951807 RepID=A0AA41ZCQ4_9SPHN|nr:DegT/DnrJ/EryC1/StrS family aminotransferase [Sphingomonas lycopersici]MCW6537269.1 DegT/DnrJ/EryC1/StrS family aminotransferase [Sphingomonas lycopersici]
MTMLPLVKVRMPPKETLLPALEQVLYSGMIAEGESVYRFESEFGDWLGHRNVLAFSSGTGALHVALLSCGVQPGDHVITTAMTAEPTNTTILQMGAIPVFADVDRENGNLCPDSVESLINERTRAICVVHYAGYVADLGRLRAIADAHGVALIEDCAHALGATWHGAPIGSIGDAAIFSFQAIKHMTTVDGGMLVVKDAAKMDEARRLRWFGLRKGVPRTEVDISRVGFKYNMNNVTATIGIQQLTGLDEAIARHIDNGRFFDRAFQDVAGIEPARVNSAAQSSYWLYTLLCDESESVERRLADIGVTASKLHRPNHLHSVFAPFRRNLPQLEDFYRRLIHIPCGWWVSETDRQRIVHAIKAG